MPSPVVVTAVFGPLPGMRQKAIDALKAAIEAVHREDGCLLYAIHAAPDDTLVMIEKWDSRDLLSQHSKGPAVAQLNAALEGLLQRAAEVTVLEPIPAGEPRLGQI
ncbi:MAG: hypothetical protein QOE54_6183 [Streptosporangiaceae bacterium]|jgi:quinol monooxygenase YgiN|nr:antibiotic biosynthesis monooxygenase [Streptosporangiaceae bacterium]MDX6433817.1 hypothetical protein [Streptosporangiaceae bacterium]